MVTENDCKHKTKLQTYDNSNNNDTYHIMFITGYLMNIGMVMNRFVVLRHEGDCTCVMTSSDITICYNSVKQLF